MKLLRLSALIALSALSLTTGLLAFEAQPAYAQVDTGLAGVGSTVKLGGTDPRVIAARIINVTLGLLGIVVLSLIIYAGFLWMTSGGDAEKVSQAKKILQNSIIGLVIILSAWGITTFVINALLSATGGGGGAGGGPGGGPGGGGLPGGGGGAAFQVQSLTPSGTVSIRNIEVRFIFTRSIDPTTTAANLQVLRASDSTPVAGTLTVSDSIASFVPEAACPAPNETRRCFDSDTEYIIRVGTGLRSTGGQSVVCGGFAPVCEGRFTSGNLVDTAAPNVTIEAPFDGQSIPADDLVIIRTHVTDDAGVSYAESFVDGVSVGIGRTLIGGTATDQSFEVGWDTTGLTTGRRTLESQAHDIDSNVGSSAEISVVVRPQHCFNGARDSDETGLDCGGADCGVCSGGACTTGADCSSGVCTAGVCVEQPIITNISPRDGRPGTMVTIFGANFGTTTGQVTFTDGRVATSPAACVAAGIDTWSPYQVVVSLPDGSIDGPVSLQNSGTGLSDASNDTRGPAIDNFDVNDTARPGLCAARPNNGLPGERLELVGTGLGGTSDRVFFNDREQSAFLSWSDSIIAMNAPVISPATYAVRARSAGIESNSVSYRINERTVTAGPVIDSVTPDNGPISEYITIQGRNFGTRIGKVNFRRSDGVALADTSFPEGCSAAFWTDTSITVKVPRVIRAGLGDEALTPGAYQIEVERQDTIVSNRVNFTVNTNAARPGLCAIRPVAGPVGTSVELIGERLGTDGSLFFSGPAASRVAALVRSGDWSASNIQSSVPTGAITGGVMAEVGTLESNRVNFAVRNCNEDASICSAASEVCCRNGACSIGGTCEAASPEAMFAWRISTGVIPVNPRVIEECSADVFSKPPSPSPWDRRSGGDNVCINSDIYLRFNTPLDPASVRVGGAAPTVFIRNCDGPLDNPCSSGPSVPLAAGYPAVGINDGEGFIQIRPDVLLFAQNTYQVILSTGIESETGIPMIENASCGAGNAYCFTFKTRNDPELCDIGSITIVPSPHTMEEIGETHPYRAVARADDSCIVLRGDSYDWDWSTSDGRAAVTTNEFRGHQMEMQTVTALGETGADPVRVRADIVGAVRTTMGSGDLFINLVPPHIEAHGPDCDEACVNAAVWARFNVGMNPASISRDDIEIKRCTNENCVSYDLTLAFDTSPILSAVPGTSETALRFLRLDPTRTVGGITESLLERGRFYRVTIRGGDLSGPLSVSGLPLSGLNTPEGFTWTFRIKDDENARCAVDRVVVAPASKIESRVGARQLFSATPIAEADACNAEGQPLISDRVYAWDIQETGNVADFVNGGGIGLIDTAPSPVAGCTNNCVLRGADGVDGRTAACGNRDVETSNSNFCRNAARTGPCTVGLTGCVTIFGDSCRLLPPNSTGSEECDEGSETSSCSASCLFKPAVGSAACGNGRLDRGEQCDPGSTSSTAIGCTSDCQLLGSRAGGSTCGNNDIAAGEACDDGNTTNGDGCSSNCLNEGSRVVRALCGNGRIEAGESCEVGPGSAATCDPLTCLNRGTDAPTCGNATVNPGEDCDDGNAISADGCSNRCLFEGSSAGYSSPSFCSDGTAGQGEAPMCEASVSVDGRNESVQLAQIIGDAEPGADGRMMSLVRATYDTRAGQADYGLQCGYTSESDCPAGTGLDSRGCCAPRPRVLTSYPAGGSSGVCRNVQISATFNVEMEPGSVQTNFILAERATGASCPDGSTPLTIDATPVGGIRGFFIGIWNSILAFFGGQPVGAQLYCAGTVRGTVTFSPVVTGGVTSTRAILSIQNALKPTTEYRVRLAGDLDLMDNPAGKRGVQSRRGVVQEGNNEWLFTTGAGVCTVSNVRVRDTNTSSPAYFSTANEPHVYTADVISVQAGTSVPLSSIAEYQWTWAPWESSDETIIRATAVATDVTQADVTSLNKNGSVLVFGKIQIVRDEVNVPSTTNSFISGSLPSTVLICENPWPLRELAPFSDRRDAPSMAAYAPIFAGGPYFNFSTMYCRDQNDEDLTSDDLPEMSVTPVALTPLDSGLGILRQYLFTYDNARYPALAGDGVGVRIVTNPLHLSPSEWYVSKGFSGTPQATTIDGYEAVKDGTTVYIAAPNTDDLAAADIYPNIYILSRNPDAKPETINIFDQLVQNMALNVNIQTESSNTCVYDVADASNPAGSTYLQSGRSVKCTADWECLSKNRNLRCAAFKSKLQRDVKRISDFQRMSDTFETAKETAGRYPALSSGSFLATFSTSRWPSWSGALASGSGNLPVDPVNRFLSCGRCSDASASACVSDADCSAGATCQAVADRPGVEPSTCWTPSTRQYICPQLNTLVDESVSRVYQYRAVNNGETYELGTELEAASYTRYRPNLPTLSFRCSNIDTSCVTASDCTVPGAAPGSPPLSTGRCERVGGSYIYNGICRGSVFGEDNVCGNGIIGSGESCEIGQTRGVSCTTSSGAAGTKIQSCDACTAYRDTASTICVADLLCGNGRIDRARCVGAGVRYGQACSVDSECSDVRDAAGTVMTCQAYATPEVCDDGAQNGAYGRCARNCQGYGAYCGDALLSPGERCDQGTNNGTYCERGSCDASLTCSTDCRGVAPYCGDANVNTPRETCDTNVEHSAQAICTVGNVGQPCASATDCGAGGVCGGTVAGENFDACPATVNRCSNDRTRACTGPSDAVTCGATGRCIAYPAERTRACRMAPADVTTPAQYCTWKTWSACEAVGSCGDGRTDPGEECDDGNDTNTDSCTNLCVRNICGDGHVNPGPEECDEGSLNGTGSCPADYGASCLSCSATCRRVSSSGGFCGNGVKEGPEQCDAADFGGATPTCRALGYDYAAQTFCAPYARCVSSSGELITHYTSGSAGGECASPLPGGGCALFTPGNSTLCSISGGTYIEGSTTPTNIDSRHVAACRPSPAPREGITCNSSCGFSGCLRCTEVTGDGVIEATVYDAVYSTQPVINARVTLYSRGIRVSETFTSPTGHFRFANLNRNPVCGQYRIIVDYYLDNVCTGEGNRGGAPGTSDPIFCGGTRWVLPDNPDESINGGYWPYESNSFSYNTFLSTGIENSTGKIFLAPRVGEGETLVVHTWNGRLPSYIDAHLVLPEQQKFETSGSESLGSAPYTYRTYEQCAAGETCPRVIFYGGAQGNPDMSVFPHANLFCFSTTTGGGLNLDCNSFYYAPQTVKYKRGEWATVGKYSFYLNDYSSAGPPAPSYRYFDYTSSTVRVITFDRVFSIDPPRPSSAPCTPTSGSTNDAGEFWLVFQQDAASGAITIPSPANTLRCYGQDSLSTASGLPTVNLPAPMTSW